MSTVRLAALAAAVAVAGTATACGSSDPPRPAEPHDPTEHGAYARCLSEHGVDDHGPTPPGPAPSTPPSGLDRATWDSAQQACASLAPGPPGPAG